MTAQATTGPARGPRPTSSTPAKSGPYRCRNSSSSRLQRRGTCDYPRQNAELLRRPGIVHSSAAGASVAGTLTRTFFSRMRVAFPDRCLR
jgi:hypothetical protein